MTFRVADHFELIENVCGWCGCHPCRCENERIERCACGGSIAMWEPTLPTLRLQIMRAHQLTEPHAAWSARHFPPDGSGPRRETPDVDLSAGTTRSSAATARRALS